MKNRINDLPDDHSSADLGHGVSANSDLDPWAVERGKLIAERRDEIHKLSGSDMPDNPHAFSMNAQETLKALKAYGAKHSLPPMPDYLEVTITKQKAGPEAVLVLVAALGVWPDPAALHRALVDGYLIVEGPEGTNPMKISLAAVDFRGVPEEMLPAMSAFASEYSSACTAPGSPRLEAATRALMAVHERIKNGEQLAPEEVKDALVKAYRIRREGLGHIILKHAAKYLGLASVEDLIEGDPAHERIAALFTGFGERIAEGASTGPIHEEKDPDTGEVLDRIPVSSLVGGLPGTRLTDALMKRAYDEATELSGTCQMTVAGVTNDSTGRELALRIFMDIDATFPEENPIETAQSYFATTMMSGCMSTGATVLLGHGSAARAALMLASGHDGTEDEAERRGKLCARPIRERLNNIEERRKLARIYKKDWMANIGAIVEQLEEATEHFIEHGCVPEGGSPIQVVADRWDTLLGKGKFPA